MRLVIPVLKSLGIIACLLMFPFIGVMSIICGFVSLGIAILVVIYAAVAMMIGVLILWSLDRTADFVRRMWGAA